VPEYTGETCTVPPEQGDIVKAKGGDSFEPGVLTDMVVELAHEVSVPLGTSEYW